jgi:hypothetical protein
LISARDLGETRLTMTIRSGHVVLLLLSALLLALAGCGGDDDDGGQEESAKLVEGTFVGKARGSDAFVAVVASPAAKGKRRRGVTVFACDGKTVCEWVAGSANGNEFTAPSDDDDATATVSLTGKVAGGSVELSDGETVRFAARPAAATAGLYTLKVSANGRFTGASAAGVGLTGRSTLPEPGPGTLRLADGTRLRFNASENSTDDAIRFRAGEARVIVLPGRRLRGGGNTRGGEGGGSPFFMRSPSG